MYICIPSEKEIIDYLFKKGYFLLNKKSINLNKFLYTATFFPLVNTSKILKS
jgi:hypothetical protein